MHDAPFLQINHSSNVIATFVEKPFRNTQALLHFISNNLLFDKKFLYWCAVTSVKILSSFLDNPVVTLQFLMHLKLNVSSRAQQEYILKYIYM